MLALLLAGCSSVDDGTVDLGGTQDSANADPSEDSAGEADETEGAADDDGGDEGDEGGMPLDVGGDGPEPPTEDGEYAGCPESSPPGWILCEDFESIQDPADVSLDYQEVEGAFVLTDQVGASGERAMEVTYREGEESAGWMVLSFGTSPLDDGDRPSHAPAASFSEIHWRLRVMTEPGWPDVGPGHLTRTVSFAGDDWTEAVVAELRSAGDRVVLEAVPSTCVTGAEVGCAGYDDDVGQEPLGTLQGQTPVYAESMSGQWVCIEGHLRLNTPGEADGMLEFWVDDVLQASRDDLDLRGTWTTFGINGLVIENRWPGGAPKPLRRWIDDVVISTQPIGCADLLDDAAAG